MKKYHAKFVIILFMSAFTFENANAFMFWNQACSFSGSNSSFVGIEHSSTLDVTGSFTIEAWINPVNSISPASQIILQKRLGSNNNGYTLYLSNGKISIRTNSSTRITGSTVISSNVWTHIAGTYNSATDLFSVYVNGIIDGSVAVSGADPVTNTDSVYIGKGFNSPFSGIMDEVRIWKKALSASEIAQYRRTTLGASTGIYSMLVLSLTFQDNESAGIDFTLTDWSNNGNDGRNHSVTAVDLSSRPSVTISPNESVELDGAGDYLYGLDNTDISPTTAITIEAWIFPRNITGSRTIVHKGIPGGMGTTDYRLRISGGLLSAMINNNPSFSSSILISTNRWTHVAFVYDASGGKYFFYVNGKKAGEGTNSVGIINDGNENLFVGSLGTSGADFDGFIDELRISNYTKLASTISRFMFQSIEQSNEPNSGAVNVVYNFDGYGFDNADAGPVLNFISNARFSHCGAIDNQPVTPIDRADNLNFSSGFYIEHELKRIPLSGTAGIVVDSLRIGMAATISDINVYAALNHSAEEELKIYLQAPNGEIVTLFENNILSANSDNLVTIFDDQADSAQVTGRFVTLAPVIKPANSLNSMFAGDNTKGLWKLIVNDVTGSGAGILYAWGIQFNNMAALIPGLGLRVFMEGFYRPVDSCVADSIRIHLRQGTAPYTDIGIAMETPEEDYIFTYAFPVAVLGVEYYLQVEHRNSMETWSAHPVVFDLLSGGIEYDFTVSADSAYGSNQIEVEDVPLRYAMFSGDVNQDDVIDAADVSDIDNASFAFIVGYVDEDITGDDIVDGSDLSIASNNAANFVTVIRP